MSKAIRLYREMLQYAKLLTETQQKSQITERIKMEFRKNMREINYQKIEVLLTEAESKLGYLKIITPKRRSSQQGYTKMTFGDAGGGTSGSKAVSNWTGHNMDPDTVKRHYRGLKRAGYKNNSHAKGVF
jgi:DNA-binding transcriptional regulator YhcF (GntR family)